MKVHIEACELSGLFLRPFPDARKIAPLVKAGVAVHELPGALIARHQAAVVALEQIETEIRAHVETSKQPPIVAVTESAAVALAEVVGVNPKEV